ncbi:MAG: hypothetical protein IT287_08835, partial [Bdellovibrionaceae bacterium]|nr:hypothetical protein [Pseudobdellovibrionaceae bacterium]
MKKTALIIAFLFTLSCTHTNKRLPSSDLGQVEESQSLSQLIRSNSKHYWGWAKSNQDNYKSIKDALKYKGLVFGDPHMGNFAPYLVKDLSGQSSVQFVPIDFDDVGEAPFILDLARYILASEAVDKKSVKKTALVEAYVYGLNNPNADLTSQLPDLVQSRLSSTVKSVLSLQDKYVDNKTSKGKFKIENGDLEKYDGDFIDPIKKILKPLETMDIATRLVLRGGSKDAIRLWALTKNKKSGIIHEFKEWQQTGVEAYSSQTSITERLNAIYDIFWPDLDPETYTIVKLNNTEFWLREKHEPLLDIPYTVNSDAERVFVATYAAACATALGQIHGRQKEGQQFAAYIKKIKTTGLKDIIEP